MKPFTVFSPQTGAVLRSGSCEDTDIAAQAGTSEGIIVGVAAVVGRQKVIDPTGAMTIVDMSQAEIDAARVVVPVPVSTAPGALGADVTLAATTNWYDGPSVLLTPGSWLVVARASLKSPSATAHRVTARLIDDAQAVLDSAEVAAVSQGTSTIGYIAIPLLAQIDVPIGATKTVRISVRSTAANSVLIRNPGDNSPAVNNATRIHAIRTL